MTQILMAFVQDARFKTTLGLIVLDWGLGLIAAVKTGQFDLKKVGQFYKTNIVPYILGYLLMYAVMPFLSQDLLPPEYQQLANGVVLWAFWGALTVTLGASIWEHLKKILPTWPVET